MIVVGAKGLAGELLEIFFQRGELDHLYFFDNVSENVPVKLFDRFPVITSFDQARQVFQSLDDMRFCLGLGSPLLRYRMAIRFEEIGGVLVSAVSPRSSVGSFNTTLNAGCCVLPGAVITTNVTLGRGCLVNPNATISHDTVLGDFVEVSPGVNVTGNCRIGDFSFLGSNCVIIPKVRVGRNVTVAAGAVVTKDVGDNCMVAGVPAVVKKMLPPLSLTAS